MKKKLASSLFMVIIISLCFGLLTGFAEDVKQRIALPAGDVKVSNKVITDLGTKLQVELKPTAPEGTGKVLVTARDNGIEFNHSAYEHATEKSRKKALKEYVQAVQGSSISTQSQQKIFDGLAEDNSRISAHILTLTMDSTSADIPTALRWLLPFLPIVRVVFGIGSIVILIALMLSTVVDLVFIGLPIAREKMQSKGEERGGSIPFVSSDAVSVVKETESSLDSSGGYKNAYLIYFKRRVLTYILISICILYLVVGEIGGLIGWLLSLGEGIVGN